jgi:hypothetical protein
MNRALNLGTAESLTKPMDLDLTAALLNGVCSKYLPNDRRDEAI